jgi:hypothetical protein
MQLESRPWWQEHEGSESARSGPFADRYEEHYSRPAALRDLAVVARILRARGLHFWPDILGSIPREWLAMPRARRRALLSEIDLDDERTVRWALRYLVRMGLFKTPWTGPTLWEREPFAVREGIQGDGDAPVAGLCGSAPTVRPRDDEAWFFVNGILTDAVLGSLNARRLSDLVRRPVTLLSNPTDGPWRDLAECVVDRTLDHVSEATAEVVARIRRPLSEGKRVLLVGHSQGTILAAAAAGLLVRLGVPREQLARLELYLVASCVDEVPGVPGHDPVVPYVEHYANERDLVARLRGGSAQAPDHPVRGRVLRRPGKQGHLLNLHYLNGLACSCGERPHAYTDEHGPGRLADYLCGRQPPPIGPGGTADS